jgi:hypothetical protein
MPERAIRDSPPCTDVLVAGKPKGLRPTFSALAGGVALRRERILILPDHSDIDADKIAAVRWPSIPQPLLYSTGIMLAFLTIWQILAFRSQVPLKRQPLTQSALNPNTASWASLTRLPGIGPARAQKIIAYRDRYQSQSHAHPAFTNIQSMRKIKGFGSVTLRNLKPYLRFGTGRHVATWPGGLHR